MRARIFSLGTAIHAHVTATSRRSNNIECFFVVVEYLKLRDKTPAGFLDISQVIVPAKHGSLLPAAGFDVAHAAPEGAVDLEDVAMLRSRIRNRHVERMAWSKAAATDEGKFFLRFGNFFLPVVIFEVGFGNAAETFLQAAPAVLFDFHGFAGFHFRPHVIRSHASVHCFARRRAVR